MKKFAIPAAFTGGILSCFIIFALLGFDRTPSQPAPAAAAEWHIPKLPAAINFAGEAVPLQRWEVREYLEKEILYNYYQPGHMLYIMRLSQKYFPLIEAQLKANNIPDDFKYLCVAESNLQNLVSKAGASGFWQFMKGTAPGYRLEVSPTVDERYHVMKSTDAACKYLRSAYERFGNWTAAAASYNCGMGGYGQRAGFQQTNNYYELQLPEETQRYIFRILAFKYIMQNADSLGFRLPEPAAALKTKTITVTKSISNLSGFAKANGTDYKVLKFLNPWLRERSLHVAAGKTYEIVVPE